MDQAPVHGSNGLRRRWTEALVPVSIVALRLLWGTTPSYLDWMIVLSVYWILFLFLSETRAMPVLTAATMVLLFGIYLSRQFGQVLDTLNLCR